MRKLHRFKYCGGSIRPFSLRVGQVVTIPLSHDLYVKCIKVGRGQWKEEGTLNAPDPIAVEPEQAAEKKAESEGRPVEVMRPADRPEVSADPEAAPAELGGGDVVERLQVATKPTLARLAAAVGAAFKPRDSKAAIAAAIVEALGGPEAAEKDERVAAVVAVAPTKDEGE